MSSWQFNEVSWFYASAVAMTILVAYESWKMRPVRGAREFVVLSASIGAWCLGYLLGFFNSNLTWKLVFLRLEYAGIISSSYFWLVFVGTYVNSKFLRRRGTLAWLAVIPVFSFILVLTVTMQHVFYSSYGLEKVGSLITLHKSYAAGFYVQTAYSYLLVIGGTLILIYHVYQTPEHLRRQSVLISLAVALILVPNSLYVTGTGVFGIYDPTPIAFALAGIVISFVMVKYRFLEVVPAAYGQVFRNVNSGIIVVNEKELVVDINPVAERILSRTSRQIVGRKLSEVSPECGEATASLMAEGGIRELQLGKDNKIYSASLSNLSDTNGEPMGSILELYDITELRNALDEIDTFSHTVAHDLKTPLSLLAGFSDLLFSEKLSEEERAEAVNVIRLYSNKMMNIVDELLTLARVRRQQNVAFEKLDMVPIVKSALLRLERFTMEKKGRIFAPAGWPSSLGYAPWVEEVWVNYISNALKYGGQSPSIYLGAEERESVVRFWVKDSGPGLRREDQEKLFKEFSRLAGGEDESGHGLGLFIVGRIMSKLGGDAGVESEPGCGSKFYFTLPKVG